MAASTQERSTRELGGGGGLNKVSQGQSFPGWGLVGFQTQGLVSFQAQRLVGFGGQELVGFISPGTLSSDFYPISPSFFIINKQSGAKKGATLLLNYFLLKILGVNLTFTIRG